MLMPVPCELIEATAPAPAPLIELSKSCTVLSPAKLMLYVLLPDWICKPEVSRACPLPPLVTAVAVGSISPPPATDARVVSSGTRLA